MSQLAAFLSRCWGDRRAPKHEPVRLDEFVQLDLSQDPDVPLELHTHSDDSCGLGGCTVVLVEEGVDGQSAFSVLEANKLTTEQIQMLEALQPSQCNGPELPDLLKCVKSQRALVPPVDKRVILKVHWKYTLSNQDDPLRDGTPAGSPRGERVRPVQGQETTGLL